MVTITSEGVAPTTRPSYVDLFGAAFRTALGADLDLAPESPQGQLIGQLALILAQQDEALVATSNALALGRALGLQLDNLASLLGVTRLAATHSTVAVTLTGTVGAVVPAGARAETAAGDHFALTADVTIGAGGSAMGTMRAVEAGPVKAAAGALTEIVDLTVGWTAVTNAAATEGRLAETDQALRLRFTQVLARNSRSSAEAIRAAVLSVDDVTAAIIRENNTNAGTTVQTLTIAAASFLVIVEGGTDAAVAAAIASSKPVGAQMSGASTVNVAHSSGSHTVPIRFTRVVQVPLKVAVDITRHAGYPGDGDEQIVQRVADWASGEWSSGRGDFDITGLQIGESLDTNRLLSPILSVTGHTVQSVTVQKKSDDTTPGTPALNERYTIATADVTVT